MKISEMRDYLLTMVRGHWESHGVATNLLVELDGRGNPTSHLLEDYRDSIELSEFLMARPDLERFGVAVNIVSPTGGTIKVLVCGKRSRALYAQTFVVNESGIEFDDAVSLPVEEAKQMYDHLMGRYTVSNDAKEALGRFKNIVSGIYRVVTTELEKGEQPLLFAMLNQSHLGIFDCHLATKEGVDDLSELLADMAYQHQAMTLVLVKGVEQNGYGGKLHISWRQNTGLAIDSVQNYFNLKGKVQYAGAPYKAPEGTSSILDDVVARITNRIILDYADMSRPN